MARNILEKIIKTVVKKTPAPARLFVSRDYLEYKDLDTTYKLKFTPDLIFDLEIVDETKFRMAITDFFDNIRLQNHQLIIVLSSEIYFEKIFNSQLGNETEIDEFIKMIPFSSKIFREYPKESNSSLVVANKAFINSLQSAIESNHIDVLSILPLFAEETNMLDYNLLRKNSLVLPSRHRRFSPQFKINFSQNRTSILMAIFFILFLVLVFMIISSRHLRLTNSDQTKALIPTQIIPSPTPSIITAQSANIEITINNFKLEKAATLLKNRLTDAGFSNIVSKKAVKSNLSTKVLVTYSSRVPSVLKNKILPELRKMSRNIVIKDSNDISVDVQIIIGQN
jgi:hypothetical protein